MSLRKRIVSGVARRTASAATETRMLWSRYATPEIRRVPLREQRLTPNDVFDAIYVLNLDRSKERWEVLKARLDKLGIAVERFPAVDGHLATFDQEWEDYINRPLTQLAEGQTALDDPEIYESGDHARRVASAEQLHGFKWINSRGALGILHSKRACLQNALHAGHEHILIFEDDVIFHRDFAAIFARAAAALPPDWAFFQLGTMRTEWGNATRWRSPNLLMNGGMAIGAHAIGYSREAMKTVLGHLEDFDAPYDVGALSTATWQLRDRCFLCMPQIAIQTLEDSNNNASGLLERFGKEWIEKKYRWRRKHYT